MRTEHAGAKNRGGFWGHRAEAKSVSRKARRAAERQYLDTTGRWGGAGEECEHCDGENGPMVRRDPLRGLVCPDCDTALDAMVAEMQAELDEE